MRFSIVIPCRDDQMGLDRAVRSVLGQTIQDIEVIVVDDGSAIPLTVESDPRVRLLRREVAGGPASARNLGLDNAAGAIIGWCDSDDYFEPNRLEIALGLHDDADVVVVGQGKALARDSRSKVPLSLDTVLDRTSPSLGATTVKRSVCPRLDERYLACQDIEWWIRVVQKGGRFKSTSEIGYRVDVDDRVRSLNSPIARLEFSYALIEQHLDFYEQHKKAHAFRWYRISVMESREGNPALARRALLRSTSVCPSLLAGRQALRLTRASTRLRRAPLPISTRPLPPLCSLRARDLVPLLRGTAESRLSYGSRLLSGVTSLTSRLPKVVRGRVRRATTKILRVDAVDVGTAWGLLPLDATEVRLLAPYSDEPLEMALLARFLQAGMTAIDVGANRGLYSLMFSARVGATGRVLAVEPDPRMVKRLVRLQSLNDLDGVLTLVDSAIAGSSGQRQFSLSTEPSLNHLHLKGAVGPEERLVTVATLGYPDLLASHSLTRVDLLKVDVEGAEPEVLSSVMASENTLGFPKLIMFEYEPDHWARFGHSSVAPTARMLQARYDLYAIDYGTGRLQRIEGPNVPNTIGRNVLAVLKTEAYEILRRLTFATTTPV